MVTSDSRTGDAFSNAVPVAPARAAVHEALVAGGHRDLSLHLFDALPSTSRWLEDRAAEGLHPDTVHGAPPVLCAVDLQPGGHGRRGKPWLSAPGNVAVSLLTHLPVSLAGLGGLSLVTGIAVAAVLEETTGLDVRIKWPNDVLVDAAKIGGLLIGVQPCGSGTASKACTQVVTGIGINVVHDPRLATLGIGGTSIESAWHARTESADCSDRVTGASRSDRDALVGLIVGRVLDAHRRFAANGWVAFADEWRRRDALAGREIDVHLGKEVCRGRALGVDVDGALRLSVDGVERNFHGGDVSVRAAAPSTTENSYT